jgi:thioredoxin reductase
MTQELHFDIGIVGGGPAGLSAAIWSARYLHSVVVIDSADPRNWETHSVTGRDLGVELCDATVLRAEQASDEDFLLSLEGGERIRVRRLLLAIGIRDVWPDIPGLDRAYGSNAHVCPDCDGYDARGKKVVVIGNGRRAVGMALNLTTWTDDIIICTNGRPPDLDEPEYCEKLDALNIPVLTEPITQVCCEENRIHCLKLEGGMQLDTDKVFFSIAQYPSDDLGAQLGCERDDQGHIVVSDSGRTSVAHVYAAGDITPGPQLAIVAAAEGATAALAMHKSLVPEERKLRPLEAVATS